MTTPTTVTVDLVGSRPAATCIGPFDVPQILQDPEIAEALALRDIAAVFRFLQTQGIAQRRIAALTRQSQSEVSEILSGRKVTSYPVLERIAAGLGVPRGRMGLAYVDGDGDGDEAGDPESTSPAREPSTDTQALPDLGSSGMAVAGHGYSSPLHDPGHPAAWREVSTRDRWSGANMTPDYRCYAFGKVAMFEKQKAASICAVLSASLQRRTDGMVTVVGRWTGLEIRALREAMRMDKRAFGLHLGVSARLLWRCEAGGVAVCPRAETQELFDTALRFAEPEARQRFTATLEAVLAALTTLEASRDAGPHSLAGAAPTAADVVGDEPGAGESADTRATSQEATNGR